MGWRRILAYLVVITFVATILLTFNSKSYAEKNDVFVKKHNVVYEDLSSYFTGFSYDLEHKQYTIYNKAKSEKRLSPNSTFKVPHALFGLQTGVLEDENTTFQWDGTEYPFPQWNQDQTLTQAIQNSTIWYFQEVSSRLGENREQYFLHRIHYGNEDISGGLTHFWLQSSLEISPI